MGGRLEVGGWERGGSHPTNGVLTENRVAKCSYSYVAPRVVCLCGGMPGRQVINVHSIRCVTVKRSVRPGLVIERQVALQSLVRGADGLVGVQIDLLVFDTLPQPLDTHLVAPTPFPVHADQDAVVFQQPRELQTGQLIPLISSVLTFSRYARVNE